MELEDKNYFSIGDVEKLTGVKPYILRYWEQEFRILRPARGVSGQRRYTGQDVALISKIKELLYTNGLTILGVRKFLIDERRKKKRQLGLDFAVETRAIETLKKTKKDLEAIIDLLK